MKRLLVILLIICISVTLISGCNQNYEKVKDLEIICTVFPQYDFVKNIVGDKANVKMLVPLGTESHDFKLENLTVAELKTIATADLIVYVGGETDGEWIEELRLTVNSNARWCALTEFTPTLKEVLSESMEHNHEHEHAQEHDEPHHTENAFDEHVWTSPKRAVDIVKSLTDIICGLDESNSQFYKLNCETYVSNIMLLDEELKSVVNLALGKKLVFGDRFPFRYLCADYGLEFDAAFPGCSSVSDPSVKQITSLTQTAIESDVKTIFYMENSKPIFAESIAKKVGGKAMLLHSCHTLTRNDIDAGLNYLSLTKQNIERIKEALNG